MDNPETFFHGQRLKSIFWRDGELHVGKEVQTITVVMENGQMAHVPWFEVVSTTRPKARYNGAQVEGVQFLEDEETQ